MEQETAAVGTADAGRPVWRWLIYAGLAIAGLVLLAYFGTRPRTEQGILVGLAMLCFICLRLNEIVDLLRKR